MPTKTASTSPEEKRGSGAEKRRESVYEEPAKRLLPAPSILQHQIHGVDAVREVVSEYRDRDNDTDDGRNLEADSDGNAVEKTVCRERERAKRASWRARFTLSFFACPERNRGVRMQENKPV